MKQRKIPPSFPTPCRNFAPSFPWKIPVAYFIVYKMRFKPKRTRCVYTITLVLKTFFPYLRKLILILIYTFHRVYKHYNIGAGSSGKLVALAAFVARIYSILSFSLSLFSIPSYLFINNNFVKVRRVRESTAFH